MGKQRSNIKIKTHNIDFEKINKLIFLIYAILITLPLLFRGGYFEKELLPILVVLNIVFAIYLFKQRKNKEFNIFRNPIEILFFGIVIMYLLSILYGIDTRGSIIESIKYFSYFAVVVLGMNLAKDIKYENGILYTIILASIIVSIIGIGSAISTWDYPGAYSGTRISSTFQYPNTLAAYLGAIYFLTLSMLSNSENRIKKVIYGMVLGILIFTFILTYSRAMWLMFPISVLLYFILIPNSRKLETLAYMIGSFIVSVPASFLFTRGVGEPSNKLWIFFVIAAAVTGLVTFILSLLENKLRSVSIKKLLIGIIILLVLVVSLGIYAINTTTEITLENRTTENKWSSLSRSITNLQHSTNYVLKLSYAGENKSEAEFLGRAVVYNINESDELAQLVLDKIVESGEGILEIPFTTADKTVGVRIDFQNLYPNTAVTFKEASILKANSKEDIVKVPLKYKYIPESIVTRFNSITAGDSSFTRRITFIKDGLRIVKDYPILGAGGEGWRTLYLGYQSEPYISNLAHNYFLQLWIEIGILGLLLIVGILLLLTLFFLKTMKQSKEDSFKTLLTGLYVTMFTMFLHAFVDFDMSLSGYSIVVWTIVGILASNIDFTCEKLENILSKIKSFNKNIFIYGLIIIGVIIAYTSGSFVLGDVYAQKGVEANNSNDIKKVMINFEKAVRYDAYEPGYRIDLSKVYMELYEATDDANYGRNAIDQVEKYIDLSPYDVQVVSNASSFYFSIGEIDKGMEYIEKAVEFQPLMSHAYIQKLDGYFALFDYYYLEGDDIKAKNALEAALGVKEQIAIANTKAGIPMPENIDLVYKIGKTQFYLEKLDNLVEIYERNLKLNFAYYFDVDINSDGNIDMLYTSKPEGSNIQYERHNNEEESFIRITNSGQVYGFIYPYGIKLEPNTKYVVELNARGNTKPETFRAYAWSNGSAEPNQGGLDSIALTEDWGTYSFEFTTDADVNPGQQYMMLQHVGNDQGYVDLKSLIIYKSIN